VTLQEDGDAPEDAGQGTPVEGEQKPEASIEIEKLGGSAAVISLGGYLHLKEATKITEAIESLALQGVKNIIFDMTNARYMNSSAIATLANGAASLKGFGGDAILVPLECTVMKVIETLGILGMFTTAATKEEAIAGLSG
jgi:anti-anti-sigma factor